MIKRFLAILLCLSVIIAIMVSCDGESGGNNQDNTIETTAVGITTEEPTTEEPTTEEPTTEEPTTEEPTTEEPTTEEPTTEEPTTEEPTTEEPTTEEPTTEEPTTEEVTTECPHAGGTATCTEQAVCTVCGKAYGELNENNHEVNAEWIIKPYTHKQIYSCCDKVAVEAEEHEWNANGECLECGYACNHVGGTATCTEKAVCAVCNNAYGEINATNHKSDTKWITTGYTHNKVYSCCLAVVIEAELHEWNANGICEECGYICSHTGGSATCTEKAICTVCGNTYGNINASNHKFEPEWISTESTHKKVYTCCDTILVAVEGHEWNSNGVCSKCGYGCEHKGGEATCTTKATCTSCGEFYGNIAPNNHTGEAEWTKTAYAHNKIYSCCKSVVVEMEMHEWNTNGVCSECGYVCEHVGGKATCTEKAICTTCRASYGELAPDNHTGEIKWTKTETDHSSAYSCCGVEIVPKEAHEWQNGICKECVLICSHSGGVATCKQQATCIYCNEDYGKADKNNHENSSIWIKTNTTHMEMYSCCGTVVVEEEDHEWLDGVCSECGYVCYHTGAVDGTCTDKAKCVICAYRYGELNPNVHTGEANWSTTENTHTKIYDCCGGIAVAENDHNWQNGICSECGYTCSHKGGEATCIDKAVCYICSESYGVIDSDNHISVTAPTCIEKAFCNDCNQHFGELDVNNHTGTMVWNILEDTHERVYNCCNKVIIEATEHNFVNYYCTDCRYKDPTLIPFIGAIFDVNGLGPNGEKVSPTNAYTQYTPHTTNPVLYYPPTIEGAWDYTCRSFSVNGWAFCEGGNGDMIWSDDMGATWKKISDVTYYDGVGGADMTPFAQIAGIENWNEFDMRFSLTIDLSGYEEDEYVTIWIGRENGYGKPVAIFKFAEIFIGDEVYVPETHDVCGHISMDDVRSPINIVSFDAFRSSHAITDAAGRVDRLRVWNHDSITGDSIANNTPRHTWNKVVRLLEKDLQVDGHIFTIEGWTAFTVEGVNETNVDFSAEIYRDGEYLRTADGTALDVSTHPGVVGLINGNSALKGGALFRIYFGVTDNNGVAQIQDGDYVHVIMTHTAADGTVTKYCIKDFTIDIVADDTDLTCKDTL